MGRNPAAVDLRHNCDAHSGLSANAGKHGKSRQRRQSALDGADGKRHAHKGERKPRVGHNACRKRPARRPRERFRLPTFESRRLPARKRKPLLRRLVRNRRARSQAERVVVPAGKQILPRHRRHRGRDCRTPEIPRRPAEVGSARRENFGSHRARGEMDCRNAVEKRRLGGLRPRQHNRACDENPVLRLRRSARPPERRRQRARRGGPAQMRLFKRLRVRLARHKIHSRRAGGRRLVVRPLGNQLYLRHLVRDDRAQSRGLRVLVARNQTRGGLACGQAEPRRRLGRAGFHLHAASQQKRLDRLADGVGVDCADVVRNALRRKYPQGLGLPQNTQTPDGTWVEAEYTGTGFPGYGLGAKVDLRNGAPLPQGKELSRGFMLRYGYYCHYFPIMALSREIQ